MEKNSEGLWELSLQTGDNLISPMIIFNNGQGGGSNQTDDFVLKDQGVYDYNGWKETSDIDNISEVQPLKIYTSNGMLVIESLIDTQIAITRADGVTRIIPIAAGINHIDNLSKGFYIVNRTKVIL